MKRLIFLILYSLISIGIWGQSPADVLFEKYAGKEGYTTVYISGYMLNLLSNIETDDPEAKDMQNVIDELSGIKILTSDSSNTSINFLEELKKSKKWKEYNELMVVKEANQDILFLIRDDGKKISELLLVITGHGDNVLLCLQGNIDLKNIGKISKTLDIEGMDKLENIEE